MDFRLILASQSPRRKTLLESMGLKFQVSKVSTEEKLDLKVTLDQALIQIAKEKAQATLEKLSQAYPPWMVLSADTVVVLEDEVLGKPKNTDHAFQMLKKLSGQTHLVKTAFVFKSTQVSLTEVSAVETSKVLFRSLSDTEILSYIESGDPMDKAGSYGIQTVGRTFIQSLEGSLENVMGLPVQTLQKIISEQSWKFL